MTPLERQRQAQRTHGYGAISLRRQGEYAIVEIEQNGSWVPVIREPLDSYFSHVVEPLGIAEAIERQRGAGYAD